MHGYDVHEVLCCNVHGPRVSGLCIKAIVLYFRDKVMNRYNVQNVLMLNYKIHCPGHES